MRPSCPRCSKSEFSYRALLSVHPFEGEFTPAKIDCPSCGAGLRVTAWSRLFAAVAIVGVLVACMFLLGNLPFRVEQWQAILAGLGAVALYHFALWPMIVRLKPWSPFQYWLPKSRVVGYTVYLLIPLAFMVLILYLAL